MQVDKIIALLLDRLAVQAIERRIEVLALVLVQPLRRRPHRGKGERRINHFLGQLAKF